jgi:hypothetical protein
MVLDGSKDKISPPPQPDQQKFGHRSIKLTVLFNDSTDLE